MRSAPHIPDLELLRRIGRGSYGEVWIARTLTGVYRAVKIVHRARFDDDRPFLRELDGITRFQRSAGRQTRQLALMHVGRDDANGFFYYVMELADDVARGTDIDPDTYEPYTLKSLRDREVLLPAAEAVRLGVELARALAGLHEAGLIHRDVKPSNIILVAGTPKLADIGLVSSGDHTLTSLGTPGYSPPEGAGTVRADIFSLGRILYELSTGRGPDEFPKLPRNLNARKDVAVLLELNEVVLRACDPDPKKRYASVGDMLDDLLLIQAGKSVKELAAMRRRLKSLGKAAAIVGAAAALVIVALGVRNYFAVKALAAQETEARAQAENDERLARYTSDLHLAQLALTQNDLGQARAALRRQIPGDDETTDPRGLEWHLLWGDAQGDDARAFGIPGGPPVLDIALSPNGRRLAAQEGEEVRTTVLWDLDTGTRRVLAENTFGLGGFSADGNALFVGTTENTLQRIELASGNVAFVPGANGRLLARAEAAPRVLLGERTGNGFEFRVFDLDAQEVAGVWVVERGETRLSLSEQALSPDGTRMAVAIFWEDGSAAGHEIVVRHVDDAASEVSISSSGIVRGLAFSLDDARLVAGGPGLPTRMINLDTAAEIREYPEPSGGAWAVAFSPDERLILSLSEDRQLWVREVATGEIVAQLKGHEAPGRKIVTGATNALFYSSGHDGVVREWSLPPPERARIADGYWSGVFGDVFLAPEAGDDRVFVTDSTGQIANVDPATLARIGEPLSAFHPLGLRQGELVALDERMRLTHIDVATGAATPGGLQVNETKILMRIASSTDGRVAAFAYLDGTVEFWNTENGASVAGSAAHDPSTIAVSNDGRWAVSGDWGGRIRVWDTQTGALLDTIAAGSGITSLTCSPDGRQLLAGQVDGTFSIRDRESGREIGYLRGHVGVATAGAWSEDGTRIITAGDDGLVIVWSASSLRRLAMLTPSAAAENAGSTAIYAVKTRGAGNAAELFVLTEGGRLRRWAGTE